MRIHRWLRRNRNTIRVVMVVVGLGLIGGAVEAIRLARFHMEEKALREEIRRLEQENREMENARDGLASDPRVIEKMAREEYGMIREGERIYRIVEPETPPETRPEPAGKGVDSEAESR